MTAIFSQPQGITSTNVYSESGITIVSQPEHDPVFQRLLDAQPAKGQDALLRTKHAVDNASCTQLKEYQTLNPSWTIQPYIKHKLSLMGC